MLKTKAFVFDAYGTLFNISSIDQLLQEFYGGDATAIAQLWRSKQLEYSWLREIMGTYKPFSEVTKEALRYALEHFQRRSKETQIKALMSAYDELKIYPEVGGCLQKLKGQYQLAVLSNANLSMLYAAFNHNKVTTAFDSILSADQVKCFKPNPKIYQLAVDELGLSKKEIVFVTANAWDATGANSFGLQVVWINRLGRPVEELGVAPDWVMKELLEILNLKG